MGGRSVEAWVQLASAWGGGLMVGRRADHMRSGGEWTIMGVHVRVLRGLLVGGHGIPHICRCGESCGWSVSQHMGLVGCFFCIWHCGRSQCSRLATVQLGSGLTPFFLNPNPNLEVQCRVLSNINLNIRFSSGSNHSLTCFLSKPLFYFKMWSFWDRNEKKQVKIHREHLMLSTSPPTHKNTKMHHKDKAPCCHLPRPLFYT